MKYGETFQAQSVPQWAPYNVDYNELKNLIKVNTTKDQGQAIAIPGHVDIALARFEAAFFDELSNQHDRVGLFVSSKADEVARRLESYQRDFLRLRARCEYNNGKPMSQKRREKFARYDNQITKCGEDIKSLQRFVDAQRTAFRKILKKYRKWTGSRSLSERFNNEILGDPKSFTRRDFEPLLSKYNDLIANVRAYTPDMSEDTTPRTRSRRASVQPVQPTPQEHYWNEYDDGSEAEHEVYTIYVNPDDESTFPGAKTISLLFSKVMLPMERVKGWLSPPSSPAERRSLIRNSNGTSGYFTEQTETDIDDEADASSSDFPAGYVAHYATFPSVNDQKLVRERKKLVFRGVIGAFAASILLVAVSGILVATGKHKLRVEVDAGVFVGVAASLFFATLAFAGMLYELERISMLYRLVVGFIFGIICVVNSVIMMMLLGDTRL